MISVNPTQSAMVDNDVCAAPRPAHTLHWGDTLTIVLYFLTVGLVGAWATFRASKNSANGYFLAGRSMTWIPIGASIYASNVGGPYFIGLAGTAAASGIGGMIFEWHAIPFIIALGWIFVPVFLASGVYTMPQYLKKRFGGQRLRIYLSVLSIIFYIITKLSIEMYSGAVFVQMLLGWNMYISGLLILGFSAIFTMTGGLTAVLFTDTLQTTFLTIGSSIVLYNSLNLVGGYDALVHKYMEAVPNSTYHGNSTCGYPRSDAMSLIRDPLTSDYPWPGTLIINSVADTWFWCTDQIMVQRSLSAKSLSHAKGGSLLAGSLKHLPFALFILPGMAARVLFPEEVACADPVTCQCICENPNGCSNIAYPLLVIRIMQPGIRGLMLAALFAACMSTLTSVFNSASSIFTMDLWTRCRKHASEWELLVVGRLSILVLAGCALMWIPIMQATQGGELWQYWQSLMSAVGPPCAMTFIFGVLWKRTTEQAAFWGMLGGQLVGLIRMILVIAYPQAPCGEEDTRPALVRIHFLYVAGIEVAVSGLLLVTISLLTEPRKETKLHRVTWWTRNDVAFPEDSDEESDEIDCEFVENFDIEEVSHPKEVPKWKMVLRRMCGMTSAESEKGEELEMAERMLRLTSIKETPRTKRILDVFAIILFLSFIFVLIYYR